MEDMFLLRDEAKALLLFGPDDCAGCPIIDPIVTLRDSCQIQVDKWDDIVVWRSKFRDSLQDLKLNLCRFKKEPIEEERVLHMFRNYVKNHTKLQHINLATSIAKLRDNTNVDCVPDIVLEIAGKVPPVLLSQSKIKKLLIDTVTSTKQKLLRKFFNLFGEHFDEQQSQTEAESDNTEKEKWNLFLQSARKWLLAYALVNLLPVVVTESVGVVKEKYRSTIDETLTPLWGRFHYHLQTARDSRSIKQNLWTFMYATSFVLMLTDLNRQISSTGKLQLLCPIDYNSEGLQLIIDKATRFMRAHVAKLLVLFHHDRLLISRIIEESLALDSVFKSLGALTYSVCSVFYDCKQLFFNWVKADLDFFLTTLNKKYTDTQKLFDLCVEVSFVATDKKSLQCYRSIYDCISFFHLGCLRYIMLPQQAQLVFSEVVLQPLLCTALGIFLYRIRTDSALYAISEGKSSDVAMLNPEVASSMKCTLNNYLNCLQYFQISLTSIASDSRSLAANPEGMKDHWKDIQSWIPKIYASREEVNAHFAPKYLIAVGMKAIRAAWMLEVDGAHSRQIAKPSPTGVHSQGSLGTCIDLARAIAMTLKNVMEKQSEKFIEI